MFIGLHFFSRFFLKFLKKNRRIQSFQVPDSLHVVFLECLQLLLQLQLRLLLLLLLLLHPFNGLFYKTIWVSRYQKDKISLDLNESRYDEDLGCSGISWTIRKQNAPHSRHLMTKFYNRKSAKNPGLL